MGVDFVHLHNHSDYSLLDGAQPIKQMVARTEELGMNSVALTDHGNLFGAVDFYMQCKKRGIKPIIGMEAYIVGKGSRTVRGASQEFRQRTFHIILLCENFQGYKNLMKLSSSSFLEGFYYKPRMDKEILRNHSDGIIGLSACLNGEITSLHMNGKDLEAQRTVEEYLDIFGKDNFYIEIQRHGMKEDHAYEKNLELAKHMGIKYVATNDVHYTRKTHWDSHDTLICLQSNSLKSDEKRMRYTPKEFYLRTPEEMRKLFEDLPEACDATLEISERCNLQLDFDTYHLPVFKIPNESVEKNPNSYLKSQCMEGLSALYSEITPKLKERLKYELSVINQMGFSGYFLITADFVSYAKKNQIPVGPGRGSAAGSLVAYALGITTIDPLKHNLLFERFLNPERVSLPDIDIDFCYERRGEVIKYIKSKYGEESVTQIITFGKMKARQVVKDVGRVMGYSFGVVDKIAKEIPDELNISLKSALKKNPVFKKLANGEYKELIEHSLILEGVNRHASTHAAGVVIAPGDLTEFIPLYKSSKGDITSQYDMKCLEKLGLLKMDFLGLRNLTVIEKTLELIEKMHKKVNIQSISLEDKKVYDLFAKGLTVGIFQFESAGMREFLKKLKPTCIEDLIAMNALYRPGPMDNINDFIKRKKGKKTIDYMHPKLEPILKETHGIIVYQEQVMQIANQVAGFSLADADLMRRAMGKKDSSLMKRMEKDFIEGAKKQKISISKAKSIFILIEKFAEYGFNKSHSTAYAYIAYQTGWLKTHYPVEFMSANLISFMSDTNRIVGLINECRKLNIQVHPPDINISEVEFKPIDSQSISYGLKAIKNVGSSALNRIISEREKQGKFLSIFDFCSRVGSAGLNRKVIESLIKGGAFDCFPGKRSQLFSSVDDCIKYGQKIQDNKNMDQVDIFGGTDGSNSTIKEPELQEKDPWTERQLLAFEKEVLGTYVSGHPLLRHADIIEKYATFDFTEEIKRNLRKSFRLGGLIENVNRNYDKNGNEWARLKMDCIGGQAEIIVFNDIFSRQKELIQEGNIIFVSGNPEDSSEKGNIKMLAEQIVSLDKASEQFSKNLNILIDPDIIYSKTIDELYQIAKKYQGDTRLVFHIAKNGRYQKILAHNIRVSTDSIFYRKLKDIFGGKNIWIE